MYTKFQLKLWLVALALLVAPAYSQVIATACGAPTADLASLSDSFARTFSGASLSDFQREILADVAYFDCREEYNNPECRDLHDLIANNAESARLDRKLFQATRSDLQDIDREAREFHHVCSEDALRFTLQIRRIFTQLVGRKISNSFQLQVENKWGFANGQFNSLLVVHTWRIKKAGWYFGSDQIVDQLQTTVQVGSEELSACTQAPDGALWCSKTDPRATRFRTSGQSPNCGGD